jgi:hypothetical protein
MKRDFIRLLFVIGAITIVIVAASQGRGPILKPVLDPVARMFKSETLGPDLSATETAREGLTSSTQVPATVSPTFERRQELIERALELINDDRAKFGLPPVELGHNTAAQVHAENMLEHRYLSHWTVDGLKPYMLYSMTGGDGYVAENAAYSGWTYEDFEENRCGSLFVNCQKVTPQGEMEDLHWRMMYDDAGSDWGHRDNILRPYHEYVNIGIAWNDWFVAFVQHFESRRATLLDEPALVDGRLTLAFELVDPEYDATGQVISIYYDPKPESHTAEELNKSGPRSYCLGGGFTAACPDPAGAVLRPPRFGFRYTDLDETDVIADEWNISDSRYRIEADVSGILRAPGVYTVDEWCEDHAVPLMERSFFSVGS